MFLLGFQGNASDFNPFAACPNGKRSFRAAFREGDHGSKAPTANENAVTGRQSLNPFKSERRPWAFPEIVMEKELTCSLKGGYSVDDIESTDFIPS